MSVFSPENFAEEMLGGGGGYGGGRGLGQPIRLPGRSNIVPYNRFPKPPRLPTPRFPRVEVPKFRPPRIPQVRFPRLPHPIIPSFPIAPSNPGLPSPDDEVRPSENDQNVEVPNYQQHPRYDNPDNIAIPAFNPIGLAGGGATFPTPTNIEITVSYQYEDIWMEWVSTQYPVVKRFLGAANQLTYIAQNVTAIRRSVSTISTNYDTTVSTFWEFQTNGNVWQSVAYSGETWHLGRYNDPSASFWFSNGQVFPLYGSYHPEVRFRNLNVTPGMNFPPPVRQTQPNRVRNPQQQDEEERMPCERCRAEEVIWYIRSLKQTVNVRETTIVPSPTGDLITLDSVAIKQVFALPGTADSIKQQFDLLAEIKKRIAHAFNQSRRAKVLARLQQVLSATDFVLNLHNALMLSEDIATTFFGTITGAVDIVIKVADDAPFIGGLFDTGETPINTGQIIGEKIEAACKSIFGVQNWAQMKQKWAAFNNIVRGAAMQIQAARDIGEAQKDLSEMTASRLGKLHNKLAKAGVLFDNDLWEEKVNRRWAWMYKLEDMAEDNAITNAAQFISSWGGQVLDIKEQKKEMQESREKFQTDLQKDLSTLYEAKAKTNVDSTGKTYTRSDINPPETDDPQS